MPAAFARPPRWLVQLVRAVIALLAGLVITFSADHSAPFGLVVFGVFALATGTVLEWGLIGQGMRVVPLLQAVITSLAGIVALGTLAVGVADAWALFIIVISFAAITGFLELYQGLLARGEGDPAARDRVTAGVLTGLLAIAVLLVPADYAAPWSVVTKGVETSGVLTSNIVVVGLIGAYAILIGVYLLIGALSARWAIRDEAARQPQ